MALRDMELRGAGNLLGREQSGFAHSVGIDAYRRLLEQTVKALKGEEAGREFPDTDVSIVGSAYLPMGTSPDSGQSYISTKGSRSSARWPKWPPYERSWRIASVPLRSLWSTCSMALHYESWGGESASSASS